MVQNWIDTFAFTQDYGMMVNHGNRKGAIQPNTLLDAKRMCGRKNFKCLPWRPTPAYGDSGDINVHESEYQIILIAFIKKI